MPHPLQVLESYFPTGTAEGETAFLRRAFVQEAEFADLVTPPPGSPRLLVGKKGSGKTAIISVAANVFAESKVPTLVLKPFDLPLVSTPDGASVGELTRVAYEVLVRAIADKMGSLLRGLVPGRGQALYREALKAGSIAPDAVEQLATLLPKIARPYTSVDLATLLPASEPATVKKLQIALQENIGRSGTGFYLFLDDTDQVAAPDRPGHLNRIWAFILAARALSERTQELRCIVSLREEVWSRLQSERAGQRDQADHFVRLVHRLSPTRAHIRAIVERRLQLAAAELRDHTDYIRYDLFFVGASAHMPSSHELSSWSDLIVLRSRDRPRDAIQLVGALARRAFERGAQKVDENDLATEMREFSRQRVELLPQEVEDECPQVVDVVRSLAGLTFELGAFKETFENVRAHLKQLPSSRSLTLYGRTLQPDNDDDALAIWSFLFRTGVLNARIADSREKDGFRHVLPADDPTLVSRSRWNDMQGIAWEVNPAYRDDLIRVQAETAARSGLPPTRRRHEG